MQGGWPAVAEGLFDGEAGEFAPAAVDEAGAAGRVGAEDADGGNFGEDAEAFLARAECGPGGKAVGEVEDGGEAVGLGPDRDETAAVNDGEDLAVFRRISASNPRTAPWS